MAIEADKNELNNVGRVLGELICENWSIPEELVTTWEATGDQDQAVVDLSLRIEMTMEQFNDLLDRANKIAGPPWAAK